jgi:hypothetical protein
MTNVMAMLGSSNAEGWTIPPIRKEIWQRKSVELLLAVVGSRKDFKVKWSKAHVGTQKACVNDTSILHGAIVPCADNLFCGEDVPTEKKKIACYLLSLLCFPRFACPNKSVHKLAIYFLPFILADRSQRSARSNLSDIWKVVAMCDLYLDISESSCREQHSIGLFF